MTQVDQARAAQYHQQGWWPREELPARYRRTVRDRRDDLAVVDSRGRQLTHAQLSAAAGNLAADLDRHGITAGTTVLIILPNWAEWQVHLLATLDRRIVPATIPVTTDRDTLEYVARSIGARAIVAPRDFRDGEVAEAAASAARGCDHRCDVLLVDYDGGRRWIEGTGGRAPAVDGIDHLMFTSSTTGRPKSVKHTDDTVAALNVGFSERHGLDASTPIFMPSPVGHSVGAMHGGRLSLFLGAPLVFQERWDPAEALDLIDRYGCAFTAAATPFLKDLVDTGTRGGGKAATLRTFLCGGAQVPPALMARAAEQLPQTHVTVLWGMTEGGVTTCPPDAPREKLLTSAGSPLPGLELQTLGPEGDVLPEGAEGELAMRGPGVCTGYFGQDELFASLLTPDGFFRTGDQAWLDPEGYVHITGRIKDLIVRGGVNISPVPTEDAIMAHPSVHSVAVLGFPDDRLGERICAVVQSPAPLDLEQLNAWLTDHGLPRRALPEKLILVEEMPRTPAGKIRKNVLRDRMTSGAEVHG